MGLSVLLSVIRWRTGRTTRTRASSASCFERRDLYFGRGSYHVRRGRLKLLLGRGPRGAHSVIGELRKLHQKTKGTVSSSTELQLFRK